MTRSIYIVHQSELPHEHASARLMQDESFRQYIRYHGWHFSEDLADYASRHLTNEDGTSHLWTTKQVRSAFESSKLTKSPHATWGDIAYAANMHYSDEFPQYLKTEAEVLSYTSRHSLDVDGYDGMQFMRWISDYIGRDLHFDWSKFL